MGSPDIILRGPLFYNTRKAMIRALWHVQWPWSCINLYHLSLIYTYNIVSRLDRCSICLANRGPLSLYVSVEGCNSIK